MADRLPPQDLGAEEAFLGAALLSGDALGGGVELGLRADHFYRPQHRHIFAAMVSLFSAGEPVDTVTVANRLTQDGVLGDAGGVGELHRLSIATPAISAASHYARLVMNAATLRRMIFAASRIADSAYANPGDVDSALADAEMSLFAITDEQTRSSTADLDAMTGELLEWLDVHARSELTGVSTGFHDVDEVLSGLQPGALYIVGARPAMGKTAFGLTIANHVASQQRPVLFVSLEMSHLEITKRLVAAEADVDLSHLMGANLTEPDWGKVGRAVTALRGRPLIADDNARTTVAQIRSAAGRIKSQHGSLALVVVDYLQLMTASGAENRQLEVSEISRGLKVLARELDVPVVALSQLSRSLEARSDKRPMLSDLRESGSLEQDADVVMFLYRDEVYHPDSPDKGVAEVLIAKHRSGPTGVKRLVFFARNTRFASVARGV